MINKKLLLSIGLLCSGMAVLADDLQQTNGEHVQLTKEEAQDRLLALLNMPKVQTTQEFDEHIQSRLATDGIELKSSAFNAMYWLYLNCHNAGISVDKLPKDSREKLRVVNLIDENNQIHQGFCEHIDWGFFKDLKKLVRR